MNRNVKMANLLQYLMHSKMYSIIMLQCLYNHTNSDWYLPTVRNHNINNTILLIFMQVCYESWATANQSVVVVEIVKIVTNWTMSFVAPLKEDCFIIRTGSRDQKHMIQTDLSAYWLLSLSLKDDLKNRSNINTYTVINWRTIQDLL